MLRYKPHGEYYHLASLLCRAGLNARAAIDRIAGRHVLTYGRHAILIEIASHPGIHVRELARRIQLSRQSTLEAARELEHRGWATIERLPPDTRLARLGLTPAGAAMIDRLAPRLQRLDQAIGRAIHPIGPGQFATLLHELTRATGLLRTQEFRGD